MSVREYRDARIEVDTIESTIKHMVIGRKAKIEDLNKEILDLEAVLKDSRAKMGALYNSLKPIFMTKVDNEVVFRLTEAEAIQILEITEE